MADNKFVTLEALKSTAARLQQEWLKSISKAGHATFRKAEAIPTVDEAQDNVMYLVMNDKTQHYDIYAKVEGAVVLLDDTTVDLSGYATKEQLEAVSGGLGGTVWCIHQQACSGQRGYPRTGQDRQGLRRRYADHQRPRRCAACGDCLHCDCKGGHQGHQRNRDERGCHQHLHQVYRVRRGRKWIFGEGLQRLDL